MASSFCTAADRHWLARQKTIIAGLLGRVIMRLQGRFVLIQLSLRSREERGHLMRTQAFVLVLIVIAASEPARLFSAVFHAIVALLQYFKIL